MIDIEVENALKKALSDADINFKISDCNHSSITIVTEHIPWFKLIKKNKLEKIKKQFKHMNLFVMSF